MENKSENIQEVSYTKRNLKSIWLRDPSTRLRIKHVTSDDSKKPLVRGKLLIEKWNAIYYKAKLPLPPIQFFAQRQEYIGNGIISTVTSNADRTWLQGPFDAAELDLPSFQIWWIRSDEGMDLKVKKSKKPEGLKNWEAWYHYAAATYTDTNYQGPADINELRSRKPQPVLLTEKMPYGMEEPDTYWILNVKGGGDWSEFDEFFTWEQYNKRQEEYVKEAIKRAQENL